VEKKIKGKKGRMTGFSFLGAIRNTVELIIKGGTEELKAWRKEATRNERPGTADVGECGATLNPPYLKKRNNGHVSRSRERTVVSPRADNIERKELQKEGEGKAKNSLLQDTEGKTR